MVIENIGQRQVEAIDLLCDHHDSDGDPRFMWHVDSGAEGWAVRVGVGEPLVTLEGSAADLRALARCLDDVPEEWMGAARRLRRRIACALGAWLCVLADPRAWS